jgi:hypothetical protein
MEILFDKNATCNDRIIESVERCLRRISTLEAEQKMPIVVFQDGVDGSYYVKCSILAEEAGKLCDLNARLDLSNEESFRANRELLLEHTTYLKMEEDAAAGREFNDIIVEYNEDYNPDTPLKVWGGQHRISAIRKTGVKSNRFHGFRIYFELTKRQRTEVALISNTNISVSNDTFDRMIEETRFGDKLRKWCREVGLLDENEDFPDTGRSEKITVKRARSFIVNFYLGKERGETLGSDELDHNVYEPEVVSSGVTVDPKYKGFVEKNDLLHDEALIKAGKRFAALHNAQRRAVVQEGSKVRNLKAFRNKAFVESVLCGWSYVAGLLQSHPERLENHYRVPKTTSSVPDPLNAEEMSEFKHDSDPPTYRGLGTRSSLKDRQRVAQLFLAKSRDKNVAIDKSFMNKAVSQVVGLLALARGYA